MLVLLIKYPPSFRGPKRRRKEEIEMELQAVGWGSMDRIDLAHEKGHVAGACEYSNEQLVYH